MQLLDRPYSILKLVRNSKSGGTSFMIQKFFFVLVFVVSFSFVGKAQAYAPELQTSIDLVYDAQFDKAFSMIDSYIAKNPDDAMAYIIKGNAFDWKQNIFNLRGKLNNKVIEEYKTANLKAYLKWEKDQDNVENTLTLGNSYMFLAKKWIDQGKKMRAGLTLKKARKYLEEVEKKDPSRVEANLALGVFNFYAGNLPSGLKFLASFIGLSGNESKGLEQLEKVARTKNIHQGDAAFVLVHAYGKSKKSYLKAIPYLDILIGKYPNNPEFPLWKQEMYLRAKKYDESIQWYGKLMDLCKKENCERNYHFLGHYFMATAYIEQKKYAQAKEHVLESEKLNINQYKDRTSFIYYNKGLVLLHEGKKADAKLAFEASIAHEGGNPKAKKFAKEELSKL